VNCLNRRTGCYFQEILLGTSIWYPELQWSLETWSRSQDQFWQQCWLQGFAKISENHGKIAQNLGTDVSTPLFSLCDEWGSLLKNVWIWLFLLQKNQIFRCVPPKEVLLICEIPIFQVSLRKFRQKSLAPTKICLPPHLGVTKPNFASLGLIGFRSRLGLQGYRSWSQIFCLETLTTAVMWLSKISLIQNALSVV